MEELLLQKRFYENNFNCSGAIDKPLINTQFLITEY